MARKPIDEARRYILVAWAIAGGFLGMGLLNAEKWPGFPSSSGEWSNLARFFGVACGFLTFAIGAIYALYSKRRLRWEIGGAIAFSSGVPATAIFYEFLMIARGGVSIAEHLGDPVWGPTLWLAAGAAWGFGWHRVLRSIAGPTAGLLAPAERLPVVTRRLK